MKPLLVIIFVSLHGIAMAQHIYPKSSDNDTLYNILLKKHLLGAYIEENGTQKHIKGEKINDTLYICINKKPKKVILNNLNHHLQHLNDSLIQAGYLFNKLQPDSIQVNEHNLHIFYHIRKNNQNRIDSLVVIPDKDFPSNIRKFLNKSVAGKTINSQKIYTITNFVNNESGYKLTTQPVINFQKGKKILVLKIKKTQNNHLNGTLGFNYNLKKKRLQLEGNIRSQFINLLNTGEQISLEWQKKSNNQLIQFNTRFPYIKGSRFTLSNFFSSKRRDTTAFTLTNQTLVTYLFKKQSAGVNYTYQFATENKNHINNRLTGVYFLKLFTSKNKKWQVNFQSRIDINVDYPKKKLFYTQFKSTETLRKHIILAHNFQIYKTNEDDLITPVNLQTDMYRKATIPEDKFSNITSFKNDVIYRTNHIDFYLIGDYINSNDFHSFTNSYVNTGVGFKFLKKNQILNIEVVKSFFFTYNTDFQDVYINIKQSVIF